MDLLELLLLNRLQNSHTSILPIPLVPFLLLVQDKSLSPEEFGHYLSVTTLPGDAILP